MPSYFQKKYRKTYIVNCYYFRHTSFFLYMFRFSEPNQQQTEHDLNAQWMLKSTGLLLVLANRDDMFV